MRPVRRPDGRGRAGTGQRPTRTPAHGRGRDPRAAPQRQRLCTAIRACRPTRSTPPGFGRRATARQTSPANTLQSCARPAGCARTASAAPTSTTPGPRPTRTPQGRARGARAAGPTSGRPAPRRDRGRRAAARQTSPANTLQSCARPADCEHLHGRGSAVIRGRLEHLKAAIAARVPERSRSRPDWTAAAAGPRKTLRTAAPGCAGATASEALHGRSRTPARPLPVASAGGRTGSRPVRANGASRPDFDSGRTALQSCARPAGCARTASAAPTSTTPGPRPTRTPQGRARGARAAGPTSGRPGPRRNRGRRAAARQTSPANTARAAADSNTCARPRP